MFTSSVCISQLFADHSSISTAPAVITHCPPLVIDAHLYSALILIGASHQTNITIGTRATSANHCKEMSHLAWVCANFQHNYLTLASHSSILWVTMETADRWTTGAVSKVGLTASAANFIKVDCPSARTKMSTTKSHRICWNESYRWFCLDPSLVTYAKVQRTAKNVEDNGLAVNYGCISLTVCSPAAAHYSKLH